MPRKDKILMLILILFVIFFLFIVYGTKRFDREYDFKIYFFNAGKADAILLSKNKKYILIDSGEESLSNTILEYFHNNGITRLEYLIITHFDRDHVGSASNIIDNIEIGKVLQSNSPKESKYYTNYLNSLTSKKINPITVKGNNELLFDDIKIVVNGPEDTYENNASNNSSLIVSAFYKDNKFLFMGDAENARIKDYISISSETFDFIKIPYHGNYLKRLNNLLSVIKSKYGVMTCSPNEGCESETIKMLNSYNIKYYMTKNGSISVVSNGKDIVIKQ